MMARPSHVSRETRHFYSREYYWSNYRHEENYWVNQRYHSHVDATHPDELTEICPSRRVGHFKVPC